MSPNKQKIKGSQWERGAVELLNSKLKSGKFKRVPGSGALGTILGESILTGDINGKIFGLPRGFKLEAKCGYGEKEMTIKKEWLDKISKEAEAAYSYPGLVGKFSGAKSGVKHFIVLDLNTFVDIMNYVSELKEDLDKIYEEIERNKR